MHSDRSRQETRLTLVYAVLLGVLTVGYRLVAPYEILGPGSDFAWNLVPVGALALFVGARLSSRWGWVIPFGAMLASDLLLIPICAARGDPSMAWTTTPFVYLSFALYALVGRFMKPDANAPLSLLGSALAGSVQFFLLTNFAVWAFEVSVGVPLYPKTLPGLLECFWMALPFSKGTFIGDLFFTSLFFAGHAALLSVARSRSTSPQEAV